MELQSVRFSTNAINRYITECVKCYTNSIFLKYLLRLETLITISTKLFCYFFGSLRTFLNVILLYTYF